MSDVMDDYPTLEISEAKKHFNAIDERLKGDRVIVIRRHKARAFAVVDLEYLSALLETVEVLSDPAALELLKHSLADIAAGRVTDHAQVHTGRSER